MPYIAIKSYPKDEEIKKRVIEGINKVLLEEMGCSQEAICISMEEVKPEEWVEKVRTPEIEPNKDKMKILYGKKMY
ncbi:MAG: tautomerase family protein [Firmicutes bacterium]|nr:tautomerase family protein [Bacillota bacterium]